MRWLGEAGRRTLDFVLADIDERRRVDDVALEVEDHVEVASVVDSVKPVVRPSISKL